MIIPVLKKKTKGLEGSRDLTLVYLAWCLQIKNQELLSSRTISFLSSQAHINETANMTCQIYDNTRNK